MIACEDIKYCKNLDVQIKLPKKLERSVRFQDKEKNLEIIGGFYNLFFDYKTNLIYGNAFLSTYEHLNKKIPFINLSYLSKKVLNKFDTKILEPKEKILLIPNDKDFNIYYKCLLKEIANNNEVYLEDSLINNIFNPLETRILEFLR